jgi:hypothetical protein
MPIRWADIPHAEIARAIRLRLGENTVGRSGEDSSRHILSRRLKFLDPEEHRRFIEMESRDLVALLRCTRDVYRDFVEKNNCRPVLEAYWVVLRLAVFPTAIAALRSNVIDYLKLARIPGRYLSLLFGVPTHTCYRSGPLPLLGMPDPSDDSVATDLELRALGKVVDEDAILWFRDIRDGGAVGYPCGGGPFATDDAMAIRRSWSICGLHEQMTLPAWASLREKLWHQCAPWSDGLFNLFGAVQEELLSQWRALPPDSQAYERRSNGRSSDLKSIVVKRSGPKPKARNTVLREILSKKPDLPCKAVCRLMDSKFATDQSHFPTLTNPEFGGRTYDSWEQAFADKSARNLVESLISRCRPKST